MSAHLMSPVGETLQALQKPSADCPQGKIRIDKFHYGCSKEGWYLDIEFQLNATGEEVRRTFRGKLIEGVKEQAMALLDQIK